MNKTFPFLISILIFISVVMGYVYYSRSKPHMVQSANPMRLLLSSVRGGDYAHPGDAEALEMVIQQLQQFDHQIEKRNLLDVGSGLGGTLHFFKEKGFQTLQGIDLDQGMVDYARKKYPDIKFQKKDVMDAPLTFKDTKFQLITMFSVSYAIQDKIKMLDAIDKIAEKGSIFVIFDYACQSESRLVVKDFAGKEIYPLLPKTIQKQLEEKNWTILKTQDLSDQFLHWYEAFIEKLETREASLIGEFSKPIYQMVHSTFSHFIKLLKEKKLSGVILYAQKL